jgi:hypothetical protein
MNCSPTLTAEEFKIIHNGLCELNGVAQHLEGVINPALVERLLHGVAEIQRGLDNAYNQDNQAFETKSSHYTQVQEELKLSSIWSEYDVNNMSDRHPFEGADRVVYKNHWGKEPVSCSINGLTWSALYVAADACIRNSGDNHHVFIEQFTPDKDDPRTLILSTGS